MPIDDDSFRLESGLLVPRSRRQFLAALGAVGLGAVAVACTKSAAGPSAGSSATAAPGSLIERKDGLEQLSLFSGGGEPDTPLVPGKQLFGFALTSAQSQIVSGGAPQVYVSKDQTSAMSGPYPATWYLFKGYGATKDTSPRSPIATGLYSARVDFPTPGNWYVLAETQGASGKAVGIGAVTVTASANNAPGTKATPVRTPVATTEKGLKAICTSPVCHMHTISLDKALQNGKPSVVGFSTPLLCQSRLCGPVNDEQILVSWKYGKQANFIHVEEFLPGPDFKPPAPTEQNQSPGFKAWHLLSEPWCFVIDRKGVIRAALGPGPIVAPQIEDELRRVL